MTVQELIDKLVKIPDKGIQVVVPCEEMSAFDDIAPVTGLIHVTEHDGEEDFVEIVLGRSYQLKTGKSFHERL